MEGNSTPSRQQQRRRPSNASDTNSVTSSGSRRSARLEAKRKREAASSTPLPPTIPEGRPVVPDAAITKDETQSPPRKRRRPSEAESGKGVAAKKPEESQVAKNEKDQEMKAIEEVDDNSTINDESLHGEDSKKASVALETTEEKNDQGIPTVVHTPSTPQASNVTKAASKTAAAPKTQSFFADEPAAAPVATEKAPAAPAVQATPVAPAPAVQATPVAPVAKAPAASVQTTPTAPASFMGVAQRPTEPSLFQQHRQQQLPEAPRSEKKLNLTDMTGHTPFKQRPAESQAEESKQEETGDPIPPPPIEENEPERAVEEPEDDDDGGVLLPWYQRVWTPIGAYLVHKWEISHAHATQRLNPPPIVDEAGDAVYPSVLEDSYIWFLIFLLFHILLFLMGSQSVLMETTTQLARYSMAPPVTPVDLLPRLQALQGELERAHDEEKQAIRVLKRKSQELQTLLATHEANLSSAITAYTTTDTIPRLQVDSDLLWPVQECTHDPDKQVPVFLDSLRATVKADRTRRLQEMNITSYIQTLLPTAPDSFTSPKARLETLLTETLEKARVDPACPARVVHATTLPIVSQWGNQVAQTLGLLPSFGGASAMLRNDESCWAMREMGDVVIELFLPLYVHAVSLEQKHPDAMIRSFRIMGYEKVGGKSFRLGSFECTRDTVLQAFSIPDTVGGQEVPPLRLVRLIVDSVWDEPFACLHRLRVFGENDDDDDDQDEL